MRLKNILSKIWWYGRDPRRAIFACWALWNYNSVKRSEFFDGKWFSGQIIGFNANEANPVYAYLSSKTPINPSPDFVSAEYLSIHGLPPTENALIHFERYGKKKGYAVSFLDMELNGGRKTGITIHAKLGRDEIRHLRDEAIQSIKRKRQNGKKIGVLFLVYNASMFPALPLYQRMQNDEAFFAKIAIIPDFRGMDADILQAYARCEEKVKELIPQSSFVPLRDNSAKCWLDYPDAFDIVCFPSPYDMSYYKYHLRWAISKRKLPIYVNYSCNVTKFNALLYGTDNFKFFWLVFHENGLNFVDYKRYEEVHGDNGVVVGYIKMDGLIQSEVMNRIRKKIVIAPHHSFEGGHNDFLLISNFLRYADFFLELPRRFPEIDFVFRPHPYFRSALNKPNVWGKERTDAYFEGLLANPNVSLSVEGDYFDLFANSDGMIQDCGSFLAEYFYTGKPQCYLLRSEADAQRAFTDFGRKCLDHCYKAFSKDDIERFISDVIVNGRDVMRPIRDEFCKQVMVNYPHATDCALQVIRENLGINV